MRNGGKKCCRTKQLTDAINRYVQVTHSVENDLKAIKNERADEQTKGMRFEITALANRLTEAAAVLDHFITEEKGISSMVKWMEAQQLRSFTNIHLVNAELDIAKHLANFLFSKFPTTILCSATLTTNKQFDFIRQRLGLLRLI